MKNILILLTFTFLASCNGWKHSDNFTYEDYKVKDYQKKLTENQDYIIIDVRTPNEYRKGHMANAINISYFSSDFTEQVNKLPKNKLIFMYCETQHRSPLASKIMKREGFKHIIDLRGGFMKWQHQNMPMVN